MAKGRYYILLLSVDGILRRRVRYTFSRAFSVECRDHLQVPWKTCREVIVMDYSFVVTFNVSLGLSWLEDASLGYYKAGMMKLTP